MVIVIVKRRENTNQLNCCCKDYQNMENLMGASNYIESARLERLRNPYLYISISALLMPYAIHDFNTNNVEKCT